MWEKEHLKDYLDWERRARRRKEIRIEQRNDSYFRILVSDQGLYTKGSEN